MSREATTTADQDAQCSAAAAEWLAANTTLPPAPRAGLGALAPALYRLLPRGERVAVGVAGPPGSGKSTLVRMLAHVVTLMDGDRETLVLSLDDYYLPRRQRERLAAEVHPLFLHRGAPGTHDWRLLLAQLDRALAPGADRLELPRFDKGGDDRLPGATSRPLGDGPRCVFLEGWIVGAPPQREADLFEPVNEVEREQDPDGAWRRAVNRHLARQHRDLATRLGARWYLRAPAWEQVIDWRWRQEQDLPAPHRRLDDRDAVIAFLATFERGCRHMEATASNWADQVVSLDRDHQPRLEEPA